MADSKISALSDGTTPQASDQFVADRGGSSNVRLSWTELSAAAPGAEIGYDAITANVTVSANSAPGTTVITCAAHTFDGAAVMATFFSPDVTPGSADSVTIYLTEGGTRIAALAGVTQGGSSDEFALTGMLRFTPSAGSHSYVVTAARGVNNGIIHAGAGTGAAYAPAFIRFTKV